MKPYNAVQKRVKDTFVWSFMAESDEAASDKVCVDRKKRFEPNNQVDIYQGTRWVSAVFLCHWDQPKSKP